MKTLMIFLAYTAENVSHSDLSSYELLTLIAQYVTMLGVIFAVLGFMTGKRANHFSAMMKCTQEYRSIIRKIQSMNISETQDKKDQDSNQKIIIRRDLLGLFNEQLFYIKKGYVSKEISLEWLKTIYLNLKNLDDNQSLIFEKSHWERFDRVVKFMKYFDYEEAKDKQIKSVYNNHYRRFLFF